jgi:hypothetical protein
MTGYVITDRDGFYHSYNDEPAVVYNDGSKYWYKSGSIHRETDAAVIRHDGLKQYWLDGKQYYFETWIKLTPISEEDKLALLLER